MNDSLRVIPLGVGNAFTTLSFHTSLVVVKHSPILIDCPAPFGRMLREASEPSGVALSCNRLNHVVITHLHADHICGLEEYLYTRKYIEKSTEKPHLYALEENLGPLWERRLALSFGDTFDASKSGASLQDLFEVHPIVPGEKLMIAGLEFEFHRTGHSIPTVGFVARDGGESFGYSADTTFDPELVAFLSQADVFFHEAGAGEAHTPFEVLIALPDSVKKKMRVVHLADEDLLHPPGGLIAARPGVPIIIGGS